MRHKNKRPKAKSEKELQKNKLCKQASKLEKELISCNKPSFYYDKRKDKE